jgi:hypothetical protein
VAEPKKIDELLRKFFKSSGAREASRISAFRQAFEVAAGADVASRTRVCGLRDGELTIEVEGSALLSELSCFRQDDLLESINASLSRERVRRIKFRLKGTGHV